MNLWMYGLGAAPEEGAALLKDIGFKAVMGSVSCVEPSVSRGMDAYLFSGTYRGPEFKGEEWLSEDIHGVKREWFSSTCPSREEVRQYNLESVRKLAKTPHIKGIVIDGCRFASPSSGTAEDAFYTCFCPDCMKKAKSMGFDPDKMKRAVSGLYDAFHGKDLGASPKLSLMKLFDGLKQWMEFRRAVTTEHLIHFAQTVHEVNPDLKAGIFIFAPALSDMVGQSYKELTPHLDLFSPMLYRCYTDPNGPACLNVEVSDLLKMLKGAVSLTETQKVHLVNRITNLGLEDNATPESIFKGFPPEILKTETGKAASMIRGKELVPIIQMDDPDIKTASQKTLEGGANEVSFFLYKEEWVAQREEALRELAKM